MHHARLALLLVVVSACSAPRLEVEPRLAQVDIDGRVGVSTSSVSATNSTSAMGLEQDDAVLAGRVDLDFGPINMSVLLQGSSHSGSGALTAGMSQGGVTLPATTPVDSDLDVTIGSAMATWDFFPGDMFELGLGLGVAAIDFDGKITSTDPGNPGSITLNETVPLPVVALRAAVAFGRFEVSGLVGGISGTYDGDDVTYYDADLRGKVRFLGDGDHLAGFISLGWRTVKADVEYDDSGDHVDADLEFNGPYLGIALAL
jgi:hypothetical protein